MTHYATLEIVQGGKLTICVCPACHEFIKPVDGQVQVCPVCKTLFLVKGA